MFRDACARECADTRAEPLTPSRARTHARIRACENPLAQMREKEDAENKREAEKTERRKMAQEATLLSHANQLAAKQRGRQVRQYDTLLHEV